MSNRQNQETMSKVEEEIFRNFIRSEHLTVRWEAYLATNQPEQEEAQTIEEKVYCKCEKPKPNYPEMVWCDKCSMEIKWEEHTQTVEERALEFELFACNSCKIEQTISETKCKFCNDGDLHVIKGATNNGLTELVDHLVGLCEEGEFEDVELLADIKHTCKLINEKSSGVSDNELRDAAENAIRAWRSVKDHYYLDIIEAISELEQALTKNKA